MGFEPAGRLNLMYNSNIMTGETQGRAAASLQEITKSLKRACQPGPLPGWWSNTIADVL